MPEIQSAKDRLFLIAAPVLTALFLLLFYASRSYFPFGSGVVSWCDMNQQVVPLLLEWKDILSGGSVFYSWQNAGGMNFWGVLFFFIASPFSFLTLFVSKSHMLLFMNILVILKLSLCAFTGALYFIRSRYRIRAEYALCMGLLYAFCGYSLLFYQNIIWLDMMYLFPLLLLSFEALIYRKKTMPYILAVSAMMIVNYYISYMVVLFILLFFSVVLFSMPGERRKAVALRFLSGSAAAALLTALVWLPCFLQYLSSGRDISIVASVAESEFFTDLPTTLAMLFPSACPLVILLYSLIHTPLKKGRIRIHLLLFLLLLLPVFLEPVNKMWHTGNYQGFPVRYGFMTVFMCLTTAAALLPQHTLTRQRSWVLPLFLSVLILIYGIFEYAYMKANWEVLTRYSHTLWGNANSLKALLVLLVLSSLLYLILYRSFCKQRLTPPVFVFLCLLLLFFDTWTNTSIYMMASDYEGHNDNFASIMDLENFVPEEEETGEFYRVKLQKKCMDVNLVGGIGFPSLSHYTSLTSQDYMFAMKKLGYSSYWMEVGGYGGTLLSDAVLSVAYEIHWAGSEAAVYENDRYAISETPYQLPLGLATSASLSGTNDLEEATRLEVQELLFETLFPGQPSPFISYTPDQSVNCHVYTDTWGQYQIELTNPDRIGHLSYQIEVTDRQTLYFDCFDRLSNQLSEHINGSFSIYVNGETLELKYPSQLNNGLLRLGTFENETVLIDIQALQSVTCGSFGVFGLDESLLASAISGVRSLNLQADGRRIQGQTCFSEDQTVFLAVPYDTGWELYIDGEKAELSSAFLGFSSFDLPAGFHTITLRFLPSGFIPGAVLSLLGLCLCLTALVLKHQKAALLPSVFGCKALQKASELITGLLLAGVLLVIYILPMLLCLIYKIG